MNKIIECIPNFSEGRNIETINKIVAEINSVNNVAVLHTDIGFDANRTVITFAGEASQIVEAAFRAIKKASELIDMRQHKGEHPRMGATDVFPLVPIRGITITETIELSKQLAQRVGKELGIQVYLYEESASTPMRKSLANCRKGEYEGMQSKIQLQEWKPDFGPTSFNAKAGVTVIGARKFLIAYNINLNTKNVAIAKQIAKIVRESGYKNEEKVQISGLLKAVRAIGWYMDEYNCAQVSTNLIDIEKTPIHIVYETVKKVAKQFNINVVGSELIGLIPLNTMLDAGKYYKKTLNLPTQNSDENLIEHAIENLGLNTLAPFNPNERILEYTLKSKL